MRDRVYVSELVLPAHEPDGEPDYGALARFRRGLQALEQSTADSARRWGCTTSMYHLLLAVKTARRGQGIDIGNVASALSVRHPSAQQMVRKAESAGFLKLIDDPEDRRRVLIELTPDGAETLEALARAHTEELLRLRGAMVDALRGL